MPNENAPQAPQPLANNLLETIAPLSEGQVAEKVGEFLQEALSSESVRLQDGTRRLLEAGLAKMQEGGANPKAILMMVRGVLRDMGIEELSVEASNRAAAESAQQNPQPEAAPIPATREQAASTEILPEPTGFSTAPMNRFFYERGMQLEEDAKNAIFCIKKDGDNLLFWPSKSPAALKTAAAMPDTFWGAMERKGLQPDEIRQGRFTIISPGRATKEGAAYRIIQQPTIARLDSESAESPQPETASVPSAAETNKVEPVPEPPTADNDIEEMGAEPFDSNTATRDTTTKDFFNEWNLAGAPESQAEQAEPAQYTEVETEDSVPSTQAPAATVNKPHVFEDLGTNKGEAFDLDEETSAERAQKASALVELIGALIQNDGSSQPGMLEGDDLRYARSALGDLYKLAENENNLTTKADLFRQADHLEKEIHLGEEKYEAWLQTQQPDSGPENETEQEASDKQNVWNKAWSEVKGLFGGKAGDEVQLPEDPEGESEAGKSGVESKQSFGARLLETAKSIVWNKDQVDRARETEDRKLATAEQDLGLTEALRNNNELQAAYQDIEAARKDYASYSVFAKRNIRSLNKKLDKANKERDKALSGQGDEAAAQALIASLEGQLADTKNELGGFRQNYLASLDKAKSIEREARTQAGQEDTQIAYRIFERYVIKEGEAMKAESRKHLALALKPLAWYGTLSWGQKRLVNLAILGGVTAISGGGLGLVIGKAAMGAGLSLGTDSLLKATGADFTKEIDQAGYSTILESGYEQEDDLAAMLATLQSHFEERSKTLREWHSDKSNKIRRVTIRAVAIALGFTSGLAISEAMADTAADTGEQVANAFDSGSGDGAGGAVDSTTNSVPAVDTVGQTRENLEAIQDSISRATSEQATNPDSAADAVVPGPQASSTPAAAGGAPDAGFVVEKDSVPVPANPNQVDSSGTSLEQQPNTPISDSTETGDLGDLNQPQTPESTTPPEPAINTTPDADNPNPAENPTAPENPATINDVPLEAIVQKGDGVSQVFARQLETNPDLQDKVYAILQNQGFNGQKGSADMYEFLVEKYGYMDANGNEIRLTADAINNRAYVLDVTDGSIQVHEVDLTGETGETHTFDQAFEGQDYDQGETLWSGNPNPTAEAPLVDIDTTSGQTSNFPSVADDPWSGGDTPDPAPGNIGSTDMGGGSLTLDDDIGSGGSSRTGDLVLTDTPQGTGEDLTLASNDGIDANSILYGYPAETQNLLQNVAEQNDLQLSEVAAWYNKELGYQIEGPKSETNRELLRVLLGKNVDVDGESFDTLRSNSKADFGAQSAFLFGADGAPGQPIPREFFAMSSIDATSAVDKNLPLGDIMPDPNFPPEYQINMLRNLHRVYGDEIRTILASDPDMQHMGELMADLKEARAESIVTEQLQDMAAKNHATLPRVKELN